MDEITYMLGKQARLQLRYNDGKEMNEFTDAERMVELRNNVLALCKELFEALDETGWKPWASSNHLNRKAFHGELVDAWHFFMNLMLHSGMTGEDLINGYYEKNKRNHERINEGYDGITGKCPECKRALDDVDAHEYAQQHWFYNGIRVCSQECWRAARDRDSQPVIDSGTELLR